MASHRAEETAPPQAGLLGRLVVLIPRGLPHVLIANVAQQALAFISVVLIASFLPPDQFALVRIAVAYTAVATILGAGGLTAPILRYCADISASPQQRRAWLGTALLWLGAISAAVSILALLVIFLSGRRGAEALILSAYAIQVPALAVTSLCLVYLQAEQRFRFLAYSQIIIRCLSLLLTVLGVLFFGLTGFLVATIASVAAGTVPLLLASRPSGERLALPADFGALARYSLAGMLVSTVGQYADLMLLDWASTDLHLVAVYSLGTIFFFAVSGLAGSVQSVATPHFTGLMRDRTKFIAALRRWTIGLIAAGALAGIAVCALAWGLERLLLGPNYAGLGLMVGVLMLRFWIWCSYAIGGAAMLGIGAIRQGTWIAVVTTTTAFLVGLPMVLWIGIWGAALTQIVAALVSAVLVWRMVWLEAARLPTVPTQGETPTHAVS